MKSYFSFIKSVQLYLNFCFSCTCHCLQCNLHIDSYFAILCSSCNVNVSCWGTNKIVLKTIRLIHFQFPLSSSSFPLLFLSPTHYLLFLSIFIIISLLWTCNRIISSGLGSGYLLTPWLFFLCFFYLLLLFFLDLCCVFLLFCFLTRYLLTS